MSFKDKLVGLFSRKSKTEEPERLPRELSREELARTFVMTNRIAEHVAAPVDVLDADARFLFSCRLVTFESYELRFERLPGSYSLGVLPVGAKVHMSTYTKELRDLFLRGTVRKSTRTELVVGDVKNLSDDNRRADFRQPLDVVGELYESQSAYLRNGIACQVLDISKSGARIRCDTEFAEGDSFILRTEIYQGAGPISFHGQVIRVRKFVDSYEYGVMFEQLTQRKLHDLTLDLEELRGIVAKNTYG